jgi:hypothetical protein
MAAVAWRCLKQGREYERCQWSWKWQRSSPPEPRNVKCAIPVKPHQNGPTSPCVWRLRVESDLPITCHVKLRRSGGDMSSVSRSQDKVEMSVSAVSISASLPGTYTWHFRYFPTTIAMSMPIKCLHRFCYPHHPSHYCRLPQKGQCGSSTFVSGAPAPTIGKSSPRGKDGSDGLGALAEMPCHGCRADRLRPETSESDSTKHEAAL